MKLKHALLLIVVLMLALLISVPAMAQDEPGATPTGEQPVIDVTEVVTAEATPEATVIVEATAEATSDADVVIIIEQPTDETPPATNSAFEFYKSVMIYVLGGAVTVFGILTVVILSLVNSNTGVRQMLHDSVSKENFVTATKGLTYTEEVFKAVTPNWDFDEKAIAALRAKVQEIMDATYPSVPPATSPHPSTNPLDPPYNISG